jgi:DNA-binding NarL/FixJ family response regulator
VKSLPASHALVLDLLAQGKTPKQAASELGISYDAVEARLSRARDILGANTTIEAVLFYVKRQER